jgi:hypothetical protein
MPPALADKAQKIVLASRMITHSRLHRLEPHRKDSFQYPLEGYAKAQRKTRKEVHD